MSCYGISVKTPSEAELGRTWRWKNYGMSVCVFECIEEHYEYVRESDGHKFCYTSTQYEAHVLLLNRVIPASLIQGFALSPVDPPKAEEVPIPPGILIAICSIIVLFLVFATLAL